MNSREHSAHITRFEQLRAELAHVQTEREYRPISNGHDGWILYEKLHMWGVVNRMRATLFNKGPVTFERVEAVEQQAAGHIDYSNNFALYCAELVNEE